MHPALSTAGAFLLSLTLAAALRAQAPANDNFANAQTLTSVSDTFTATGNNAAATGELGEQAHGSAYAAQSSVWFAWTAPANGAIVIDTIGSFTTTSHAVYTGTSLANLVQIAQDALSGVASFAKTPVPVTAGTRYYIAVGSRFDQNDRGFIRLNLAFATAPTITGQPAGRTVAVGDTLALSVTALGASLTYQWIRNGIPLAGATAATLTVAAFQLEDAGSYVVTVTNPTGTVTSTAAILSGPNPPPTITTPPTDRLATAGNAVSFIVAATGAGSLQYQWRRNGFPIPGATGAAFTVPSASRSDIDLYDVRVNDGLSVTYSRRVRLDVQPAANPQGFGLDPAFNVVLETEGGGVSKLRRAPDGKILIAGNFLRYEGATKPNLARLNANGSVDATFIGAAFDAAVSDIAVQADGKLIAAGNFSRLDSLPRAYVARLNANGTPDAGFTLDPTLSLRSFSAVAIQADGKILLAGDFTATAGAVTRTHLIRLLPDGTLDPAYAPSPNAAVRSLALQPDGKLLVAGSFTTIAGNATRYLARLNIDGTVDSGFNLGTGPGAAVNVVALAAEGRILAGGGFSDFNGAAANGLIRLRPDGSRESAFPASSGPATVIDVAVQTDGRMVVAAFSQFSGGTGLARYHADFARDPAFQIDADPSGLATLAVLDDGRILAGGLFRKFFREKQLGGVIAFSGSTGSLDRAFATTLATGGVGAIAPLAGGKLLIGGTFSRVNGVARSGVARLNADGSLDPAFVAAPNDTVAGIAVQGDGRIVITGYFTRIGDVTREAVARLNADGSLDASFNARAVSLLSTGSAPRLTALAEGRVLLAGGELRSFVANRRAFARLHADGSLDPGFASFAGPDASAGSFIFSDYAVLPDERLLYSNDGSLSSGGIKAPVLGRLAADGRIDPAFTAGTTPQGGSGVYMMSLLPDGKILIGGGFTNYNGVARNRLARLLPDGALDPEFAPSIASTSLVTRLLPAGDGSTYVFRESGAVGSPAALATALSRITATQSIDPDFAVAFTAARTAFPAVLLMDDGNLLLAGESFSDGATTRTGLMRTRALSGVFFQTQPVATTLAAGGNLLLTASASGTTSFTYQWFKDGTAITGANRSTYTVSAAQASVAGIYFVRLTHAGGTLDSAPALVTIDESAPIFASATPVPAGLGATLQAGTRYALTAPGLRAGSTPLSYQWTKDGVALSGETGAALFRAAWSVADAGTYRVMVSNSRGSVTSQPLLQAVADTPNWSWATPLPQGNSLNFVSHVNGVFFASGQRGTLLRSANGLEWTAQRIAGSAAVGPIAFGNGRYVVLTSFGGMLTSTDGIAWTSRESGLTDGRTLGRIAFGGGRFVAVGSAGTGLTSADGLAWTTISLPTTDAATAVAFGAGRWLVLTAGGRVLTSTDGIAWSVRSDLPENTTHLAYGAGLFVTAALNATAMHTSPDGLVWTPRLSNASASTTVLDLHFADGGFLAALATSAGRYLSSADGITWREITPATSLNTASFTLTRAGNIYVMAAAAPDLLRWSADGVFWSGVDRAEGRSFRAIATNGAIAVAVGTAQPPVGRALSSLLNVSHDGVRWSERSSGASGTLNDIAYGGAPANLFVAVGGGGGSNTYITSPDGVNWTSRAFPTFQTLRGVKHVNGRFLAVGDNTMLASTDGTAWTPVPLTGSPALYQVAYGAGAYVAVGTAGLVLRSTDAINWTPRGNSATGTLIDVIFAAGKFVAVSTTGEIITSPDGLAWSPRISGATALASIVHAGGRFLALGPGNGYFLSTDAEIWTAGQHGSGQGLFDTIEFKHRLVAVGAFGSIVTQALPAPAGAAAPVITAQPAAQNARGGQAITLAIAATGAPAPTFQWLKDDVPIPGATDATLTLTAQFAAAGAYSCVVTTPAGAVTSASAAIAVSAGAQLSNLSIRATLAAAQMLTVGLAVGGNGGSKPILIRAAGPALAALGVPGVMVDPKIELYSRGQKLSENDNWPSALSSSFAGVGAFAFPAGSRDAADLRPLVDATSIVASGTGPGVVLVECYDTDLLTATPNRLINLSARSRAGTGADILIAGFFIAGTGTQRLLIRGIGPGLTPFGVGGVLADPKLELYNSAGARIDENDNWPAALAPAFASVGAFALPAASRDAALVATLAAGRAYTVQVSGVNGTTGEALVEIYELP